MPKTNKPKKSGRLQISINKELFDAIESECCKKGITKTEYITKTVERYLENSNNINRGDNMAKEEKTSRKQIHIRIDEQTYHNIKHAASKMDVSLNSFISMALNDYTSSIPEKLVDIEKRIEDIEVKLHKE